VRCDAGKKPSVLVESLMHAADDLPFAMLGIDTDNDSAFMNQTVFDHCRDKRLEQTRSRAYKKNDPAWVEQKNSSIVRRIVGYARLSGLAATHVLARLHASSRLFINFFISACVPLKHFFLNEAFLVMRAPSTISPSGNQHAIHRHPRFHGQSWSARCSPGPGHGLRCFRSSAQSRAALARGLLPCTDH
jgi:hypothetical protein